MLDIFKEGTIGRWNYETKVYDPYTIDPSWNVVLYTQDMDLAINCASCGKAMTYGQGYTSRELHTQVGMGYPVCEDCYEEEYEREKIYKTHR